MTLSHLALRCERCVFWRQLGDRHGLCQHFAPWPRERAEQIAHWPLTRPHEGCGDGVPLEARPSGRVRCGDCVFWRTTEEGGLQPQDRGDGRLDWWDDAGLCTRHAGRPTPSPGNRAFWCATNKDDGCAEGQVAIPPE